MEERQKTPLEYHSEGKPGKIEVVPTKSLNDQRDLTLAYSPGVADPCLEIHRDPLTNFKYTARGNLVAVVSNGTAVLGLGNIGPLASKPVMEGKGVLFKKFAGIDVFDIEVGSEDPDEVVRFCQLLEPTVGGINLEDVRAPDCFVIEDRLKATLGIPVFHDDQHGTAIISAAALLNAVEIADKALGEVRVVMSGAGASAISSAEHFVHLGVRRENIVMVDRKGVIHEGREGGMNEYKARFATRRRARTLAEAMVDADVFVGLSVKGVLDLEMVASMAKDPIIFALANPDPEILPEEVAPVRDDAIMATGRSDYPNQVNNVLGFPFIFRGALDVRASRINQEMKLAATKALAELARADVPESVQRAYGGQDFEFGPEYLIPKPFDPRVLFHVAPAVAQAAIDSGVAGIERNMDEYRDHLIASLGPGRRLMRSLVVRAREDPPRVVLSDGYNPTVIRATASILEERVALPILLGDPEEIRSRADEFGVNIDGAKIIDLTHEEATRHRYAEELHRQRLRKGLTLAEARAKIWKPFYFSGMMLRTGEADAMVAGVDSNYPEVMRPVLEVVGVTKGVSRVAGLCIVTLPSRELLFCADTTVNIVPREEDLAQIGLLAAKFVRDMGIRPRVAMLSFANFGSARHYESEKVWKAAKRLKELAPGLEVDGEMQADTAVNPNILRELYSFSDLRGPANVLVFPNLAAANISYKLLAQLGGAEVIGPILLGMDRPVHILQRGSTALDIIHLVTIAAVDVLSRRDGGSSASGRV